MKTSELPQPIENTAKHIKLLILDVDGVLTDGRLYYSDNGIEMKTFHVQDGQGLKMLQENGISVAIITSRKSSIIDRRMAELGIDHYIQGQKNKTEAYETLLEKFESTDETTAYVGDDLVDLPLIRRAGLGIVVANANPLVAECADWQTESRGGEGAVREICDMLLTVQGKISSVIEKYL